MNSCGSCGFSDRWLLHYVRLRGEHRRLCTSCVLKLHPASFCSICFELVDGSVAQHERISCQKCRSVAHPGCVRSSDNIAVATSYLCPSCRDPKFVFFNGKRNSDMLLEIDLKRSMVLLCAAKLAAESMTRAVHVAEADAHRRVKEATVSRKRAKEALQEICALVAREKNRKLGEEDIRAAGSANRVDQNGVGTTGVSRDRTVMGSSATVHGSSSNAVQGVLLGSVGNLSVVLGEDKRAKTNNGDAGRSGFAGNGFLANSMNVDSVGNTRKGDGKRGSSPSRPAEDGKR